MNTLPYHSLNEYFRSKYNTRVQKITVSLPFKCPHGRCIYCLDGSIPTGNSAEIPLEIQLKEGIRKGKERYGEDVKFMAYFQSYTNTNAPAEKLKELYDAVLGFSDIIGLDIGTRPDCMDDEKLELLDSYKDKLSEIWVEYGLQSSNDRTLKLINRGHDAVAWEEAVKKTKKTSVKPVGHIIIGLPGENYDDYISTALVAGDAGLFGIKIHPMHVLRGTPLEKIYKQGDMSLNTAEEYVKILADILELIPEETVVMRFTGEAASDVLIAPEYCSPAFKPRIKAMLTEEFACRQTVQGARI